MKKFFNIKFKELFKKYSINITPQLIKTTTKPDIIPKSLVPAPKNKLLEDILDTVFAGGN